MEGLEMWQREKTDIMSAKLFSAFPLTPMKEISMSVAQNMVSVQQYEDVVAELGEMKREMHWIEALMSNASLSASQKVVAWSARQQVKCRKVRQDGLTPIYVPVMEEQTGLSGQTIGTNLSKLADSGIIAREMGGTTEKGQLPHKHIAIAISKQLEIAPDKVTLSEKRNHGGKRVSCPSCGSSKRIHRKYETCVDCGTVYNLKDSIVDEEGQEYVHPEMDSTPDPEYDVRCKEDAARHLAESLPTNVTPMYPKFYYECPMHSCPECKGFFWKPDQDDEWRCSKCYPAYFRRKDQA